jgi:2-polyprenyl-6-methoxyphenol hydroxylase-like FAD-dependent oxidoreductase
MSSPFKVIVVGGGPVGLIAAHALSRAQIDFAILERRPHVVEEAGAALLMLANGQRVLGQLGLLDALERVGCDMTYMRRIDHNKNDLGGSVAMRRTKEK